MALRLPASSRQLTQQLTPMLNGPLFAVVNIASQQYHITQGDVLMCQGIRGDVGERIALKKVSMIGGPRFTAIGRPLLERARILCEIEEQKRARGRIYLNTPKRRLLMDVKENAENIQTLRVLDILYEPDVVAEVDKYSGATLFDQGLDATANKTYWMPEMQTPMATDGDSFSN